MDITDETAESLRFISTTQRAALSERRRYEWRTFLTTITLYVLVVSTVYSGNFQLPKNPHTPYAIFFVALLIAVISSLFLYEIHAANGTNKVLAEAAEQDLVNDAALDASEIRKALNAARSRNSGWWAFRWQCVILVLVSVISATLIVVAPDVSAKSQVSSGITGSSAAKP